MTVSINVHDNGDVLELVSVCGKFCLKLCTNFVVVLFIHPLQENEKNCHIKRNSMIAVRNFLVDWNRYTALKTLNAMLSELGKLDIRCFYVLTRLHMSLSNCDQVMNISSIHYVSSLPSKYFVVEILIGLWVLKFILKDAED